MWVKEGWLGTKLTSDIPQHCLLLEDKNAEPINALQSKDFKTSLKSQKTFSVKDQVNTFCYVGCTISAAVLLLCLKTVIDNI